MPRVPVGNPTFDCQELVFGAAESAVNQTFGDGDLVVVDDGRSGGTVEAQQPGRLDRRMRILR